MNIENLFIKQPIKPLTQTRRNLIYVGRGFMFLSVAFVMYAFILSLKRIQHGTPEIYTQQYLRGFITPLIVIFQALFCWFITEAQLHPATARRSLIICLISFAIFGPLSIISFWLALHLK